MEVGEDGDNIPITRYVYVNDSCIKVSSDESHFNAFNVSIFSVGSAGQIQCPQITTFLKRKESRSGFEPRSFRLPA